MDRVKIAGALLAVIALAGCESMGTAAQSKTNQGAVLGGLAGSSVGGGRGSTATGIVGAVVGGIIGNNVESNANVRKGLEITVRLDNGELKAIVQDADEAFRPGERVRLLSDRRTTRVTH